MMSNGGLFGTDGIRGPYGEPPLDRDTIRRLGLALGRTLTRKAPQPRVLLAGDTRASTPQICLWVAEGLAEAGCIAIYGGTLPTPAIAYLTPQLDCAAGVAVSASHNPAADNGIKLLDAAGFKWQPDAEHRLEEELAHTSNPGGETAGELLPDLELRVCYLNHLTRLADKKRPFAGLQVALDTANGAASGLAQELFERLGADVESTADDPNGRNINERCGSTHPERVAALTTATGCRLGFAFDGDADRMIAADEQGVIRNGDAALFLLAAEMQSQGLLEPPTIVATSMSNLGLTVALGKKDISVVRCDVGDRVVVETLRREGLLLGGEQSGHIVRLDLAPTGDGLQSALLMALAVQRHRQPLSSLLTDLPTFPQRLVNVRVKEKPEWERLPTVQRAARSIEAELGERGRLVLRYSGTEPLARVMIEGPDEQRVDEMANGLAEVIAAEIGAV